MNKNDYDLANEHIDLSIKRTKLTTAKVILATACISLATAGAVCFSAIVKLAIDSIDLADKVTGFIVKYHDLISMVFNYSSNKYDNSSKSLVT